MRRRPPRSSSTDLSMPEVAVGLVLLCFIAAFATAAGAAAENAKPSLDEALAHLKVPPDWFDEVKV